MTINVHAGPLLTFTESLSRRRKPKRQKRTLPAGASVGDDQAVKKRPPRAAKPAGRGRELTRIISVQSGGINERAKNGSAPAA